MNAIDAHKQFQDMLVTAYQYLNDEVEFEFSMLQARLFVKSVKGQLRPEESRLFLGAARKSFDVMKKCSLLGLKNIERRLQEYGIHEQLSRAVRAAERFQARSVNAGTLDSGNRYREFAAHSNRMPLSIAS